MRACVHRHGVCLVCVCVCVCVCVRACVSARARACAHFDQVKKCVIFLLGK